MPKGADCAAPTTQVDCVVSLRHYMAGSCLPHARAPPFVITIPRPSRLKAALALCDDSALHERTRRPSSDRSNPTQHLGRSEPREPLPTLAI